jgi:DNA-binding CsgD family transcriptional regulator
VPAEAGGRAPRLLGRGGECERLDTLLREVVAGRSQAVVLRGEAGVGKTALLEYLTEHVDGWRVARCLGAEWEMELAFSGLHQLCAQMLDRLDRLPEPQRDALAGVFGLSEGPVPDRFLVGLATLSLFAEVAEGRPLICIVDDAHWLDQASAQILGFVARRLVVERIAIVCAARTGLAEGLLAGVPEFAVGGLNDSDARALLLGNVHGPLDAAVADQIISESHGNPLALLELPRTWAHGLAGGFGLPSGRAVAGKVEHSYAERVSRLPPETQLLLLAGAAEPLGDPVLLRRAAEALGLEVIAADPAVDAGLLSIGRRVEFSHPLVRSAVYRTASADDLHRVHQALADATDAETDPDRRAWHRARATSTPDEDVAAELERSAGRAQSRGGLAAAGAFLARAAELTLDPGRRADRALAGAFSNVQAGAFDDARGLLAIAESNAVEDGQRAHIDLLRAQLAFAASRGNDATPFLLAAAQRLESLNPQLARETYLDAFAAALFGARLNKTVTVRDVADAARTAPRRTEGDPTAADLLLDALIALADDYEAAVPASRLALKRLASAEISPQERMRWLWQGCVVALELWDDEAAYALSRRCAQSARESGALSELALALSAHTPVLVFSGDLIAADAAVAETRTIEEAAGIVSAPYGALILTAWRGRRQEASELIEITMRGAESRGEGVGVAISEYARAVLSNSAGRHDEALLAARSASEHREVVAENWGLSELAEPAVLVGEIGIALDATDRVAKKARACGTDWALGIEARSRALIAAVEAEDRFRDAIAHLERTRVRAELARTRLLYGEWLAREGRRGEARSELTTAYELFNGMTMEGFAERARSTLTAMGAKVAMQTRDSRDQLTAQEALIAGLARDGLSNPEIGAQLFLSARTVEWHLRKVFAKLGVSSRRQLGAALPDGNRSAAAVGQA